MSVIGRETPFKDDKKVLIQFAIVVSVATVFALTLICLVRNV